MSDLNISRDAGTLGVELNRPSAINALTGQMIATLREELEGAGRIELSGTGPRGFCAGADIRELRSLALRDPEAAGDWLDGEYDVDLAIARIGTGTAHLHGISMGGGLGLSLRLRVEARQDLVLAMPEVGIGLWPDVGVTFELSRAPRLSGRHLAMTGSSIDAASALWAGLVDAVVDEHGIELDIDPEISELARSAGWIEACYDSDDPIRIVGALRSRPEPEAHQAADLIVTRCPMSVAVALEAVRRAEGAGDVGEVLATDRVLGRAFMRRPDFCEGVRAQLVDKDHDPHWSHSDLGEVTRAEVERIFDGE